MEIPEVQENNVELGERKPTRRVQGSQLGSSTVNFDLISHRRRLLSEQTKQTQRRWWWRDQESFFDSKPCSRTMMGRRKKKRG